jgi:CDP-paratose 2-epimerase
LDIRHGGELASLFREHRNADRVLHLAAQVAVTTSVTAPREDFEINALGTFNVLEAMREAKMTAPVIYSSTNKVYGEMTEVGVAEQNGRYAYQSLPSGVPETRILDFHSPYGCSKGSADQYMIDYHRIYGLRTIVFRQSCIYGYRQMGAEDQGWVAWFMIASQLGRPITIYGDGMQVRDILFVEDLLDAYDAAFAAGEQAIGKAFNIGGGPQNVLSLLELLRYIEERQGRKLSCRFADWRPGDQKVFVSDIHRSQSELGWKPRTDCIRGLGLLYDWISQNHDLFAAPVTAEA